MEGAIYATVMHINDGMKVLKDSYPMVMIDGCHRSFFVKMIRQKEKVNRIFSTIAQTPANLCSSLSYFASSSSQTERNLEHHYSNLVMQSDIYRHIAESADQCASV